MAEFKEILRVERVDESGNVLQTEDIDLRRGIVGEAAPTENTPGMAGLPYYVVRDGKITAEYVCVAAEDGVYTWKKKESGTGGGTVDDTLTVPGAAADAKAVGDKVAELSKAINNKAGKTGWSPNKYLGTDASGNMIEKDTPAGGTGTESGGVIPASLIIDTAKYGITAIDYEPPFTEEMYHVAYNNGVGIQNAINDAKAAGMTEITIPAGNYPLCYHANAKNEYNPVIRTNGINLRGYGVKLYVIYDEDGTNPYYTWTDAELEENGGVQNHYMLMGKVINADSNVEGFEIVGERRYRTHENSKYREFSGGIQISHWANSNVIKNCKIHHFSGDGIGGHPTFENVYVSGDVSCPSGKMINGVIETSTDSWISPRMGIAHNVDVTKPLQIAQTGYKYFIWTKKQLSIHCFTKNETYITTIRVSQGNPFIVPVGTFYVYVEMYSGGVLTEDSTTTVTFRFGNMYYFGTTIENCESYLNQRGGISNVPSGSIIKNCTIHHNGGAFEDMVAFYDGTQFGVDIEDWYIDSLHIDGCTFYGQLHDVLFRCNKLHMKDCILHDSFKSLNYAVDVWLENCKFYGAINFTDSASFGDKFAINCTADYGFPSEIKTVGTAIASANLDTDNTNLLVFKDANGEVLFSVDLSYIGRTPGDDIVMDKLLMDIDFTEATVDNLTFTDKTGNISVTVNAADSVVENGLCLSTSYSKTATCSWVEKPTLGDELAIEVLCFGIPNILCANMNNVEFMGSRTQAGNAVGYIAAAESKIPYIKTDGSTANSSEVVGFNIIMDDGTAAAYNATNLPDAGVLMFNHIVLDVHADGTMQFFFNGYPAEKNPTTTDYSAWDFNSLLNGFYFLNGAVNPEYIIKSARMYNRCLTKEEIRNNLKYEVKRLGEIYRISVTKNNCTVDNLPVVVKSGTSYTATVTAKDGYTLDGATITIMMGDADITESAYADGVISIESVTGDVIITITAVTAVAAG